MMSKEETVQLKQEKKISKSVKNSQQLDKEEGKICIIHYLRNSKETDVRPLTEQSILKIKEAASVRQSSSDENARLREITDKLLEELGASVHGYHRRWEKLLNQTPKIQIKMKQLHQNWGEDPVDTQRQALFYSRLTNVYFVKKRKKS